MVYNLVSIIARRNLSNLSSKTVIYKNAILQSRAAVKFHPSVYFSTTERKLSEPKPDAPKSGGDLLKSALPKILSGKVDTQELLKLSKSVTQQAQWTKFKDAPTPIQIIGFSSLVPFAGIPLLIIINGSALPGLVFAELAYGATVLAFLGGSNWIDAISKGEITLNKLCWGVTPQLIGFTSLVVPTPLGLLLSAVGLSASLTHDVLLTSYPQWYKSMRYVLTAGAIGSMTLTFFLNIIF